MMAKITSLLHESNPTRPPSRAIESIRAVFWVNVWIQDCPFALLTHEPEDLQLLAVLQGWHNQAKWKLD